MRLLPILLLFLVVGSAGGWAGQDVWSPSWLGSCLLIGAVFGWRIRPMAAGTNAPRPRRRALVRSVAVGLVLAAAGPLLWMANDILLNSGGVAGRWEKSLLGALLGAAVGAVVAWQLSQPRRGLVRVVQSLMLAGWMGIGLTAGVLFLARTGVRDPHLYPPAETSPYRLPWPAGATWLCSQGNRGVITHRGHDRFAYDFAMPIGSPVCAARSGVVVDVIDHHDGNGFDKPGNGIRIRHDDGTLAEYWHIRRRGSRVRLGDTVRQGQLIAESGNVGYSTSPHLHFEVHGERGSLPVSFRDVASSRGIPRMGRRYTSGNE